MRNWLHIVVGLLDCAIIGMKKIMVIYYSILVYFIVSFTTTLDKKESDHISVAILYYFAAALVCVVNILQWIHIKYRVKSVQFHKTKLMAIFAILFISYLLRGILNTTSVVSSLNWLNCYNYPFNWGYCLFLIIFYGIELFIPL